MSTFELEIWDDECDLVTFYTVRWTDAVLSETDKFFDKYIEIDRIAAQELLSFLRNAIGTDHSAVDEFFNRPENGVFGLPPKGLITVNEIRFYYPKFPLRLYALRIRNREDIVVLFNGGLKSSQTNQGSPDLISKFRDATSFGRRIDKALQEGIIIIDETSRTLRMYNGSGTITL